MKDDINATMGLMVDSVIAVALARVRAALIEGDDDAVLRMVEFVIRATLEEALVKIDELAARLDEKEQELPY